MRKKNVGIQDIKETERECRHLQSKATYTIYMEQNNEKATKDTVNKNPWKSQRKENVNHMKTKACNREGM